MSTEIIYMQGNGDISPDISPSPTVQELQHAEEQLLDCDDAVSIAALIYVIDKYVEWAQVINRLDQSLIQSNKFVQFRDITRSLGKKLVTNRNKLRLLADKILQNINLELNVGSGGDTESGMNASPVEQADSGPNAAPGDNWDSDQKAASGNNGDSDQNPASGNNGDSDQNEASGENVQSGPVEASRENTDSGPNAAYGGDTESYHNTASEEDSPTMEVSHQLFTERKMMKCLNVISVGKNAKADKH